jgi:GTP cyclohydrolase I
MIDNNKIENAWWVIFNAIGENAEREGLKYTPTRIAKMYQELFRGYQPELEPVITTFENGSDGIFYDEMILDSGSFTSFCEHHALPFFGTYHFAYMPNKKIIGLSKVARVVDYYSARFQIQERLTKDIVDALEDACEPKGIALILDARHLCKEIRGVKKNGGSMLTSEMRGLFRDKVETKNEFLALIQTLK